MVTVPYNQQLTALLVIDPYNDFMSEGGKVWDRLKAVAEANRCVPHMLQVLHAARKAWLRVFYALHRRYRPGDYETWKYIFTYAHRVITGGIGHNLTQEAPQAFAEAVLEVDRY